MSDSSLRSDDAASHPPLPDLLPCAHCGSKDIDPTFWLSGYSTTGPGCNSCSATAESFESWNRRAPDPVRDELVKALEFASTDPCFSLLGSVTHDTVRAALAKVGIK